jgi:hypothetical protein
MKETVYLYFNSDLFIVVERGDLVDVYANHYLTDVLERGILELKDVIAVSINLGEL